MTVNNPAAAEPYEAFIESGLGKLRTVLLEAEVGQDVIDVVMPKAEFAFHTTRYLFNGPPMDTMLRNTITRATATRLVNKRGVPVWNVTPPDGGIGYEVEESILTPEQDWKCVYNPLDEPDDD